LTDNVETSGVDDLVLDTDVRALFEFIPNLHFFIKDRSGRLVFCNATHRYGLFRFQNATALYGKENYDFFPSVLATAFAEDDHFVMASGRPITERVELNITNAGALCWFCTTKIPARNIRGEIVGLLGISRKLEKADERLGEYSSLIPSIEYINQHLAQQVTISKLARLCHMTEATYRRKFKKLFRMTPVLFLIRMRIHNACTQLMKETDSIGEIAYRSGFDDQNYFTRQFRIIVGTTPTEFRRRWKSNTNSKT